MKKKVSARALPTPESQETLAINNRSCSINTTVKPQLIPDSPNSSEPEPPKAGVVLHSARVLGRARDHNYCYYEVTERNRLQSVFCHTNLY